ncbi:OmpA family protein [Pedobacter changchengzhani]|uniref:OmpA family protein n=1 Tax=Pedobacter changchengzhani TaxID=2529274 RepID=A0A4V2ZZV9_9SPHI|nr:OmpA family protein [Pedobacter changchengzhani]TDG34853.1 OmpA family protein [Pedobacter changchengzhani]
MKKIVICICIALTAFACKQKAKTVENTETPVATVNEAKTDSTKNNDVFDINKIPISDHDLGEFPYLSAPDKYGYGDYAGGMRKTDISDFDKEYFAVNGKLIPQEGKSCKVGIDVLNSQTTQFNSLIVEKSFEKAILALGGVQVNNVPVPQSEIERIGNKELIDKHYGYSIDYNLLDDVKTYVIRTKDKVVWIQFSLLNKESGRITFLEQGKLETLAIKKITADQMKADIDANGKAVLNINFDTNKSSLQPDGQTVVNEIGTLLKANPNLKLSIEGYTDNVGNPAQNKQLSIDRANTVVNYLVAIGIPKHNLKANGFGAEKPLVANDTDLNRARNRRVELVKF